ncbi:Gfo/Idh/MocA family oxidoreductase [Allorhizobium sp. BGMRC 0089]|uniref:Gfo/Idh/MocA family protein n=1 Tax=Allorhizobium sonneratiae TaxID=2934936 RepID=UPI0020345A19|nr:Gfo/Idh/MocA family oxidoreductase [Allorhizobium sonneratiae]MCM2293139.1 Gfo/Idh/MocA family oxidoreductase [Allorhizobium sonneratiae]
MATRRIRRFALVGTGHRATTMWGRSLLEGWSDYVGLVALCDLNPLRAERSRDHIGVQVPIYTDFDQMMAEVKPELVIVCTRDDTHDELIVKAMEAGADVISEKPMTTTVAKIKRILEAEKRTGRRLDVSFNYRFAPTSARIKELLNSGVIGDVTSVDFHWYLDTSHGADYFRRWHAFKEHSGSLFVHKATHHFDLLNWYLDSDPDQVSAFADLKHYGKNGPFRGTRCRTCPHKAECDHYVDMRENPLYEALYEEPSALDGYVRDACVFREEIDIPDTMVTNVRYQNGVTVSYSLNTYMPIEGHHIAFNGHKGRIELRQYEKQPWTEPPADEIVVMRNFGPAERIWVPHSSGGHYGGDDRLRNMLMKPGLNDELRQRAGSRAGAMSVLCGIAALESSKRGSPVAISEIWGEDNGIGLLDRID